MEEDPALYTHMPLLEEDALMTLKLGMLEQITAVFEYSLISIEFDALSHDPQPYCNAVFHASVQNHALS